MNFRVEHLAQGVNDARADAAEAFCQSVGAKKHHGAGFRFAEGLADSAGVRAHQIDLQLRDLFGGNSDGRELAEAGVDAVGGFAGGYQPIDDGAGSVHALDRVRMESNLLVAKYDRVQLVKGQIVAGQQMFIE